MSGEQWKESGFCYECRKRSYCGTECSAHKRRVRFELDKLITHEMDKATHGAYSKIMEEYTKPRVYR